MIFLTHYIFFNYSQEKHGSVKIQFLCPDFKNKQRIMSLERRYALGFEIRVTPFFRNKPYLRYQIADKKEIVIKTIKKTIKVSG